MRWVNDNRGNLIVTVLAVILGIFVGLLFHASNYDAEAVIGGVGNVTDTNNPHNFRNGSSGVAAVSMEQVCIFCHTPHRSITNTALINGPLWNHTLSEATYIVNTAGDYFENAIGNLTLLTQPPNQPDGTSRMCLSCHDGTLSIGLVQSRDTAIEMDTDPCLDADGSIASTCNAYIGTDLTTKHVVSIPINDQLKTDSYNDCGGSNTIYIQYPWEALNANIVLRPTTTTYAGQPGVDASTAPAPYNGKYRSGYAYGVQCSTCHDPHFWVDTNDDTVQGYKFIVDSFNNLCNACHVQCSP